MKTENLKLLLKDINSIAVVGISSNPSRDSYKVMQFLYAEGYEISVNPNETKDKILGLNVIQAWKKLIKLLIWWIFSRKRICIRYYEKCNTFRCKNNMTYNNH